MEMTSVRSTPCPKCGKTDEVVRGICPKCGHIRDLEAASAPPPPTPPKEHRWLKWTGGWRFTLLTLIPGAVVLGVGIAVGSTTMLYIGAVMLGFPLTARFFL